MALKAPRNLKAPPRWRFSALKNSSPPTRASAVREVRTGVRWATPASRAAASRTSAKVGSCSGLGAGAARVAVAMAGAGGSAVGEGGRALRHERGHALLLVGGGEHGVKHAPLEADAFGERGLVGPVDAFLGH